jgi:hypothetical protein
MGTTSEATEPVSAGHHQVIDLTVDARAARWFTASSKVGYLEAPGRRRRRKDQELLAVPQGQQHAYRPGDLLAACGTRLTALHRWDDRPFTDGLLNRCPDCVQRIRQDAARVTR